MFEQYDTIKALREPNLHLIEDCSCGMLAVRKRTRGDLLSVYYQLKTANIKGVPEIYSAEAEKGCLIVIREYIKGKTLAEAIAEGKTFSAREAVAIVCTLCDILSAIHGLTPPVIHRDIKPSNIMLKDDGSIYLIDFDAARQFKKTGEDTELIGTHGYAAPEQYGFGETDARADIYAAGILLKELLNEDIPDSLRTVISTCTRMDPAHRYQSASALKKALAGKKAGAKRLVPAFSIAAACIAAFTLAYYNTANNTQEQQQEEAAAILSVETPAASPVQTPEPTPVPTPNPWLDILWPSSNPYRIEHSVSDYSELKETLDYILENPNQLYMIIVSGDITATEDITIPTNTKLYIGPSYALRMAPGTTLVNNGAIQVDRGSSHGTLQLMDNSTLYCMSRKTEGYREITIDGTLDCGNNVTIARELHLGQYGQYPLIHLSPGGILRCADESTLHVSGYRYVFLDSRAEFPTAPFIDAEGEARSADIRMTDISTVEEMKAAFDEARTIYSNFTCAVDIIQNITIQEDITVPDNVSLKLFRDGITVTVAEGAKFTVGTVNAQLENDTSIRVLNGGTLHYRSDNLTLAAASRVYAEQGGKIICDHKNVAEIIGLYD